MNVPEHITLKPELCLESKFPEKRGWWRTRVSFMDEHKDIQQCPLSACNFRQNLVPFDTQRLLNVSTGLPSPNRELLVAVTKRQQS